MSTLALAAYVGGALTCVAIGGAMVVRSNAVRCAANDEGCYASKTEGFETGCALLAVGCAQLSVCVCFLCCFCFSFCCYCFRFSSHASRRVQPDDASGDVIEVVVATTSTSINTSISMNAKDPPSPCCICLEPLAGDGAVALAACGHSFHEPCISEWLRRRRVCPLCIRQI